jgi:hypothetical protein
MSFKKIFLICAVSILAGCSVSIDTPPDTTIKAENDLTNLYIDVMGKTTQVDGIDLANVYIGDVYFSYVNAGYSTVSKISNSYGQVSVDIDTAIVMTTVLGIDVEIPFTNISTMSTTIESNTSNTVVFDETSAGVILSGIAKK